MLPIKHHKGKREICRQIEKHTPKEKKTTVKATFKPKAVKITYNVKNYISNCNIIYRETDEVKL